jgi:hypothetical protein
MNTDSAHGYTVFAPAYLSLPSKLWSKKRPSSKGQVASSVTRGWPNMTLGRRAFDFIFVPQEVTVAALRFRWYVLCTDKVNICRQTHCVLLCLCTRTLIHMLLHARLRSVIPCSRCGHYDNGRWDFRSSAVAWRFYDKGFITLCVTTLLPIKRNCLIGGKVSRHIQKVPSLNLGQSIC